jgi:hypothetical protein
MTRPLDQTAKGTARAAACGEEAGLLAEVP